MFLKNLYMSAFSVKWQGQVLEPFKLSIGSDKEEGSSQPCIINCITTTVCFYYKPLDLACLLATLTVDVLLAQMILPSWQNFSFFFKFSSWSLSTSLEEKDMV